jgi:tRNA nucleotidyltransferase (CCA-adding enzyme)
MALMRHITDSGELDFLVPERVWQETRKALAEQSPEVFITVLRDCGALRPIMPELDQLFGVPQRADYHPEIDTGVHSLMALQQATLLSPETRVRFATLVHDLGKGTTPAAILPRHIGHEQRGLDLVTALCKRLRVPNDHRELAQLCCQYHGRVCQILEAREATVLKLLQATDALRRPQRFAELLLCCEADSRGRSGFEQCPVPQTAFLRVALRAALSVDHTTLMATGLRGKKLGDRIQALRVEAIRSVPRPELDAR